MEARVLRLGTGPRMSVSTTSNRHCYRLSRAQQSAEAKGTGLSRLVVSPMGYSHALRPEDWSGQPSLPADLPSPGLSRSHMLADSTSWAGSPVPRWEAIPSQQVFPDPGINQRLLHWSGFFTRRSHQGGTEVRKSKSLASLKRNNKTVFICRRCNVVVVQKKNLLKLLELRSELTRHIE